MSSNNLTFILLLVITQLIFVLINYACVFLLWIILSLLCRCLNFSNFILLLMLDFNSFFVIQALYHDLLKDVRNSRSHYCYPFLVKVHLFQFFVRILTSVVLNEFAALLSFSFLKYFLCPLLSFPHHIHNHWFITNFSYFGIKID